MLLYGIIMVFYIKDAKNCRYYWVLFTYTGFFHKTNVFPVWGYEVPIGSLTIAVFFCFFPTCWMLLKYFLKYYSKYNFLNYATAAVAMHKICTVVNGIAHSIRTICLWSILSNYFWGAALKLVLQIASNSAV